MRTRYDQHVRELERRILTGPGSVSPALRKAAAEGSPFDDPLVEAYLDKVRRHAYKVTDREMEELKEAGWAEDQIFELTIAAAYGAGKRRLDAGLAALESALAARATAGAEGAR